MTDTHKIIEVIYKTVCNNFEIDWQEIQHVNNRHISKSAILARQIISYLMAKNLTDDYAIEFVNISDKTLAKYKVHIRDLRLKGGTVNGIIINVNDKVRALKSIA